MTTYSKLFSIYGSALLISLVTVSPRSVEMITPAAAASNGWLYGYGTIDSGGQFSFNAYQTDSQGTGIWGWYSNSALHHIVVNKDLHIMINPTDAYVDGMGTISTTSNGVSTTRSTRIYAHVYKAAVTNTWTFDAYTVENGAQVPLVRTQDVGKAGFLLRPFHL